MLGEVYEAKGNREEADAEFQRSFEILNNIQSRPELVQTMLAYGRFKLAIKRDEGESLLNDALELFEDMGAMEWIEESAPPRPRSGSPAASGARAHRRSAPVSRAGSASPRRRTAARTPSD